MRLTEMHQNKVLIFEAMRVDQQILDVDMPALMRFGGRLSRVEERAFEDQHAALQDARFVVEDAGERIGGVGDLAPIHLFEERGSALLAKLADLMSLEPLVFSL